MPKLYTAQGVNGTTQPVTASPNAFGAQIGESLQDLGQTAGAIGRQFAEADKKLQDQRDSLDLARLAGEYDQQIDAAKAEIAKTPDIQHHGKLLLEQHSNILNALSQSGASPAVQQALKMHSARTFPRHAVDLAHIGRKIEAERQVVEFSKQSDFLIDQAASSMDPQQQKTYMDIQRGQLSNMVRNGLLDPSQAAEHEAKMQDRYWTQRARVAPEEVMILAAEKSPPAGMDAMKVAHYSNIAMGVLNERDKTAQADIKKLQDGNEAALTASLLRGEQLDLSGSISQMVEGRALDQKSATFLLSASKAIDDYTGSQNVQRGLAEQLESDVRAMKYKQGMTPEKVTAKRLQILSEFKAGRIDKGAFTHLLSTWQSTNDWVNDSSKAGVSSKVSQAHTNMLNSLRTVGPMNFDSLAQSTMDEAERYFYAEMDRDPNQDPWKVNEQARRIFEPVLKERRMLSDKDKSRLDDAKMESLKERKAISPAAYQSWKSQEETRKGQQIVDEAIKALPPPVDPSTWDRIKNFFSDKPTEEPKRRKAK